MTWDLLGFLLIGAAALIAAAVLAARPGFPFPKGLLLGAIALRLVGSSARYEVLHRLYDGIGDAAGYYASGWILAQRLWQGDLGVFSPDYWLDGARWWGTPAIRNLSGIVLSAIGPTMRGEFLVFGLLSFTGLFLMALAVVHLAGRQAGVGFAAFTWLWPSLWYWPACVGKESVIVFGIGLVVYGFAGDGDRLRWLPYLAGLGTTFAVRPHVALALAAATGIGLWLGSRRRLTPGHVAQAVLLAAVMLVTLRALSAEFRLIDADLEGVQEFVSFRAQQTLVGGSSLGVVPTGLAAVPMAFVNIWLRPLPWEVHNAMAVLSALEVLVLWALVWWRRRDLRLGIRRWRHHRLLQLALPFLAGYTLMIGLTFGNLGIIARQRSPLFAFLFLLLCSTALFAQRQPRRRRPLAAPIGLHRPVPVTVPLERSHPERSRRWAGR